jgi:hypothetical protein
MLKLAMKHQPRKKQNRQKKDQAPLKTYYDQVQRQTIASGQAFAVVLGQCSPAIVDQVWVHEDWDEISQGNDVISFLRLLRGCMYGGATNSILSIPYLMCKPN